MLFDSLRYSVDCDAHGQKTEAEEHGQQHLAPCRDASRHDDGNREDDEHGIEDCAGDAHCEELCYALTTLGSWIWKDLPVVGYRSTFRKVAHYDGHE